MWNTNWTTRLPLLVLVLFVSAHSLAESPDWNGDEDSYRDRDEWRECLRGNGGEKACGYDCQLDAWGHPRCAEHPAARCHRDNWGNVKCGFACERDNWGNVVCAERPGMRCQRDNWGNVKCGFSCLQDAWGSVQCASTRRGECWRTDSGHVRCEQWSPRHRRRWRSGY